VGRKPLSYLFDIGFTRDVWAHRIDIAVATGMSFEQDAGHDGWLVADLVPSGPTPMASRSNWSSPVPPEPRSAAAAVAGR
jgi:hypothetical protein